MKSVPAGCASGRGRPRAANLRSSRLFTLVVRQPALNGANGNFVAAALSKEKRAKFAVAVIAGSGMANLIGLVNR